MADFSFFLPLLQYLQGASHVPQGMGHLPHLERLCICEVDVVGVVEDQPEELPPGLGSLRWLGVPGFVAAHGMPAQAQQLEWLAVDDAHEKLVDAPSFWAWVAQRPALKLLHFSLSWVLRHRGSPTDFLAPLQHQRPDLEIVIDPEGNATMMSTLLHEYC